MKTLLTSFATATLIILSTSAHCQTSVSFKETGSASPAIAALSISNLNVKPAENGFKVSWEAQNQFQIARFELQLSEDGNHFSTVKRRACPAAVNGKYEAVLNNTIILASEVYYRIKIVSMDGEEAFTESYRVKTDGK